MAARKTLQIKLTIHKLLKALADLKAFAGKVDDKIIPYIIHRDFKAVAEVSVSYELRHFLRRLVGTHTRARHSARAKGMGGRQLGRRRHRWGSHSKQQYMRMRANDGYSKRN
jgi:hypothetical protein